MRQSDQCEVPAPTEAFFHALETKRTRALIERDLMVVEELHAPDYQLIAPNGSVFSRDRYIAELTAAPFYVSWEIGPMSFRLSNMMAVMRYRARLTFPSAAELVCWHTDIYERRADHWQAVWSQATALSQVVTSR